MSRGIFNFLFPSCCGDGCIGSPGVDLLLGEGLSGRSFPASRPERDCMRILHCVIIQRYMVESSGLTGCAIIWCMAKGQSFPYDSEIAEMIWERIAVNPIGLDDVLETLANEGVAVPSRSTWYHWLKTVPEMADYSARAREMQADCIVGLAVKHAMTDRNGERVKTDKDGVEITTGDNVERSKLIYQALMRRAGQLNPKVYGEKITHAGDPEQPLEVVIRRVGAKSE